MRKVTKMAMRKKTAKAMEDARSARAAAVREYSEFRDSVPQRILDLVDVVDQSTEGYNDLIKAATMIALPCVAGGGTEAEYFDALAGAAQHLRENRAEVIRHLTGAAFANGANGDYAEEQKVSQDYVDDLISDLTDEKHQPALSWVFNQVNNNRLESMPCSGSVN
jgi:hypothetical protein